MHESSIAQSLVELAEEQLLTSGGAQAARLRVKVGPLSGVEVEALRFAFGPASLGSGVDGAILDIEQTIVMLRCAPCGQNQPARSPSQLSCALCGERSNDVVAGRELELVSIELSDATANP